MIKTVRIAQYAFDPLMCNTNDEQREIARLALELMDNVPVVKLNSDNYVYRQGYQDALKWAAQLAEASQDHEDLADTIRNGPYPPTEGVAVGLGCKLFEEISDHWFEEIRDQCADDEDGDEDGENIGFLVKESRMDLLEYLLYCGDMFLAAQGRRKRLSV